MDFAIDFKALGVVLLLHIHDLLLIYDLFLVSEYKVPDLLHHPIYLCLSIQVEEIEVSTIELYRLFNQVFLV
jgi:hypothetical protein